MIHMSREEVLELAFTLADTCRITGVSVSDTIFALATAIGMVVGTQPHHKDATPAMIENHILTIIRGEIAAQVERLKEQGLDTDN